TCCSGWGRSSRFLSGGTELEHFWFPAQRQTRGTRSSTVISRRRFFTKLRVAPSNKNPARAGLSRERGRVPKSRPSSKKGADTGRQSDPTAACRSDAAAISATQRSFGAPTAVDRSSAQPCSLFVNGIQFDDDPRAQHRVRSRCC